MNDVHYPLLFTYSDTVRTETMTVQVITYGRCLLVQESEGCWVYGVSPGPIAESGSTGDEALLKFRAAWRGVLADIALEAPSVEAFRAEVERTFWSCDAETMAEWNEAVAQVRAGKVDADLPKVNSDTATIKVEVRGLPRPGTQTTTNFSDVRPAVAA